jgi:hypothetical protein
MYIVIYILAAIVFVILILVLIAPKTYDVSRTIHINAPSEKVFPYLKYLKKQEEWSPWAKKDPDMKKKFTGIDGEVGAVSYWNGNKEVGEGEQEITKIIEGNSVEGELRFLKPFKSISRCYLISETSADKMTNVTWGFSGNNKFPMSIIALFMSMDKMVGKDFEAGLASLKTIVEK